LIMDLGVEGHANIEREREWVRAQREKLWILVIICFGSLIIETKTHVVINHHRSSNLYSLNQTMSTTRKCACTFTHKHTQNTPIGFDFIWSEKHPIGFDAIWRTKHPIGFHFIWSEKHSIGLYAIWRMKTPQLDLTSFIWSEKHPIGDFILQMAYNPIECFSLQMKWNWILSHLKCKTPIGFDFILKWETYNWRFHVIWSAKNPIALDFI
jgi:hypothetical protein